MPIDVRFVDLAGAEPDAVVVVIDVLRAFTTVPWMLARGATRLLTVDTPQRAIGLRRDHLPDALLSGEEGGARLPGFDLGNSPSEVATMDLEGRTIIHRTAAGTQGLTRTTGSRLVFAASFVVGGATALALTNATPDRVTFVVTGASLGRDGDEDLACAELIAARIQGDDPDPAPFLARVRASDAGRSFVPGEPSWAPPEDLRLACEVDRFAVALPAWPAGSLEAVEIRPV